VQPFLSQTLSARARAPIGGPNLFVKFPDRLCSHAVCASTMDKQKTGLSANLQDGFVMRRRRLTGT
jgi:hypothetical protein